MRLFDYYETDSRNHADMTRHHRPLTKTTGATCAVIYCAVFAFVACSDDGADSEGTSDTTVDNSTASSSSGTANTVTTNTATTASVTNNTVTNNTTSAATTGATTGGVTTSNTSTTDGPTTGTVGTTGMGMTTAGPGTTGMGTMGMGAGGTGAVLDTTGSTMSGAGGTGMNAADTWDNFAMQFFADYCNSCHTEGGSGINGGDFSTLDGVKAKAEAIACGVAKSEAVHTERGCAASPQAQQFPAGPGAKPSDEERDRLLAWIDAGMP